MKIYQGYPIALIAFLSTGLTIGASQYAFGEFVTPLQNEFGWTQTQLNLSMTFAVLSGLSAPFIGNIADRWGVRIVMLCSLLSISAGFLLRTFMTSLWLWYFTSALIYLGFHGATILPSGKLVGNWFPVNRGKMMGLVTSGNNVGGLLMPPFAVLLISKWDWRFGYFGFGIIIFFLLLFVVFIIKEKPQQTDTSVKKDSTPFHSHNVLEQLTLKQILRTKKFWYILVGLTGATFTYQGILTQLRQHFEENGFPPQTATLGLAVIAALGIASKLFFGRLSELWSARSAIIISLGFQTIGAIIFAFARSDLEMWLGIIFFGIGFGGLGALIALVIQEAFGLMKFGTLIGLVHAAGIISMGGAPVLAGWIHDKNGEFDQVFIIIAFIFILSMICFLIARGKEISEEL